MMPSKSDAARPPRPTADKSRKIAPRRIPEVWAAAGGEVHPDDGGALLTLRRGRKTMQRTILSVARRWVTLGAWWEPFAYRHRISDGYPIPGFVCHEGFAIVDSALARLRAIIADADRPAVRDTTKETET
jgi:hypothetical protein